MTDPAVSIIVPAYNAAPFVRQTLDSVRAQTFQAWECLIVDDGSTDQTNLIVADFVARDARMRCVRQRNRGLPAARNQGLARTQGAYVQFLDADDLIAPDKLSRQVAVLDASPAVDVSYSNYRPFDDATGEVRDRFWPEMLGSQPLEDFLFKWERGLSIPIHTALFRRTLWPDSCAFDETLEAKEDWAMWIDLALRNARFEFMDVDLAFYRLHGGNLHRRGWMRLAFLRAALTVYHRLPDHLREPFLLEATRHVLSNAPDLELRRVSTERRALLADLERLKAAASANTARPPAENAAVTVACTIICRNYLSHARLLSRSYLEHHPAAAMWVLVVDGLPEGEHVGDGVFVVRPEDLGVPYLSELRLKYDVVELCTALKPLFLEFLFDRTNTHALIYLDPDTLVFRRFDEVAAHLADADIVLTPHSLEPLPLDGKHPTELDFLRGGAFNLGFLALRRSVETDRFLQWWADRLRDGCYRDLSGGQFVDQKWLDLVPIFFAATAVLRDPSYNVAYWNLASRRLERADGQLLVDGRPLAFFHFSGVDIRSGTFSQSHQNRIAITRDTPLAELMHLYRDLQFAHGYETSSTWPLDTFRFDNGESFNWVFRELYAGLRAADRASFGEPTATGTGSFFRWALTPDREANDISPFLQQLYRMRRDVAAAFPDLTTTDRERFLDWASGSGADEMGYHPSLPTYRFTDESV